MNIQERRNKDGKITSYRIRVFDHRDVSGKQVFRTLSVKFDSSKSENWNRKNAEKQGAVFEKGIQEQTLTDARITFDDYAEYVIKIKEQAGITQSTAVNYNYHKKRLAPFIGHIQLKNLTPNVLNRAYAEMIEAHISSKYVHELHTFVHNVLEMAFKEGIIPKNYASAATPPKKSRPEVNALSETDLKNFFAALYSSEKNYFYQVFFTLLLASGCRVGELCALKWNHIDFAEKRIHICQHFVLDRGGRHVENGCKTVAGERWLYMDDSIMQMLSEYRAYYTKKVFEYGSKWDMSTMAVFYAPQKPGDYLSPNTVRAWLDSFTKKHNLPKIHPHQFRHTSISLQLQAGISVPDAAKRAGHSRPDVTMSIYAHTLRNNDRHCCEAVTKAIPILPKVKES
ncbi:MAG: site-specific integrase [Ruminococcus sp.]|nr:site-specific integrase [Ruminococcus sp.]MCM1382195.1 site-specific integrase [Muribaculaceae bacterium]